MSMGSNDFAKPKEVEERPIKKFPFDQKPFSHHQNKSADDKANQNLSPNYPAPNYQYNQPMQQQQPYYQQQQQQNIFNNPNNMYGNSGNNQFYGQQQPMYGGGGPNYDPMGQNYYQGGPNNMNPNFPNPVIYVKDNRNNFNQNPYKDPEVWDPPSPKGKQAPMRKQAVNFKSL